MAQTVDADLSARTFDTVNRRSDRVADVWLIVLFSPVLICIPILMLLGVIFVVVPGGFIVVLAAAAYFLSVAVIWLVGLLGRARQHALRANRRRTTANSAQRPAQRAPSRRPGAASGSPVTAGLSSAPTGVALNVASPSPGTGGRRPPQAPDTALAKQAADQRRAA
jgi:hypothetical protein